MISRRDFLQTAAAAIGAVLVQLLYLPLRKVLNR